LGLGTVGLGVYQHLKSAPHLFEVVGVGVRHPDKYQGLVPNDLITDQIDALLKRDCDLVVELIGGLQDAEKYVVQSLLQKRHVITANKLLIAEKGEALQQLAHTNSVQLLYSAAVGGSIPILEQISHFVSSHPNDSIQSITGILNGTCNYILDEISKGKSFHEALINAQKAGFAEADPSFDISGKDTAHKLKIIARFAFGEDLKDFPIEGIYEEISKASAKLIAHCEKRSDGLHAWVLPQSISKDHPLSHVRGVDNGVVIQTRLGKTLQLKGKGAGGLPTAESVYADLLSIILETPLGIPKTFETPFSFKVAL
jgi:homoserine dehydrogenase